MTTPAQGPEALWINGGHAFHYQIGGAECVRYIRADLFAQVQAERDAWRSKCHAAKRSLDQSVMSGCEKTATLADTTRERDELKAKLANAREEAAKKCELLALDYGKESRSALDKAANRIRALGEKT
jgi:alkanesulfonate monooxygenase SsuD/methylene tetrahydromethanopterin reductase-like flavin-dependent oxidoreductase (luciferase family)